MLHVNRVTLERGRGVLNGVAQIRREIKSDSVELITRCVLEGKQNAIASGLNDIASKSTFPYAGHYVRSLFGLSPLGSSITQTEVDSAIKSKHLTTPIVEVVPEACEKCCDDHVTVTDLCMSCTAHPCDIVCPVNAVHVTKDRSQKTFIDPTVCIRCERCIKVCPYTAIVRRWRPCKVACGVEAITIEKDGRSVIHDDKCVYCGLCSVSCPFGAIVHKSEIGVVATKLATTNRSKKLAAIVAPAFVNQFGKSQPQDIFAGIKALGFDCVVEVAYGADLDTVDIAEKLNEKKKGDYLATSCCTAWVKTVQKHFPSQKDHVVDAYAPMIETAKALKKNDPNMEIVFIGPCIAKISEILDEPQRSLIEHCITFEELACLFKGKAVALKKTAGEVNQASAFGRGYAQAGGVADAVAKAAKAKYGMKGIDQKAADTLLDCVRLLKGLEDGSVKHDLVEGMGCPGGCIGGAGTIAPPKDTKKKLNAFMKKAKLSLDDSVSQDVCRLCK